MTGFEARSATLKLAGTRLLVSALFRNDAFDAA